MSAWIWAGLTGLALAAVGVVAFFWLLAAVWPGPYDTHDRTGPLWFRLVRWSGQAVLLVGLVLLLGGMVTGLIR